MSKARKPQEPPRSGETRTTVGAVSGLQSKTTSKRNATDSAAKGKSPDSRTQVIQAEKRRGSKLPLHETTAERIAALQEIRGAVPGHSSGCQRTVMLAAIRRLGRVTVPELSFYGGMGDPRPRKHELKKSGIAIEMMWVAYFDASGELRRCGAYYLDSVRGAA